MCLCNCVFLGFLLALGRLLLATRPWHHAPCRRTHLDQVGPNARRGRRPRATIVRCVDVQGREVQACSVRVMGLGLHARVAAAQATGWGRCSAASAPRWCRRSRSGTHNHRVAAHSMLCSPCSPVGIAAANAARLASAKIAHSAKREAAMQRRSSQGPGSPCVYERCGTQNLLRLDESGHHGSASFQGRGPAHFIR